MLKDRPTVKKKKKKKKKTQQVYTANRPIWPTEQTQHN